MPSLAAADTIRILVATDSHVGYNERDHIRGDDSWKSFHEVMCLAKSQDVDMVLLAGDLFHENKPSRKSMYQVMRSLRLNCYGEKPCELEMLSDGSENFQGAFNHVNYEDPDINVAIPVFSIHGNHDDPSGEGHLAALDLLQISGLLNYYGRTPESDNIVIKPVLLQKGQTKLALYGMSNVRDERLFRTFRDGKVKFFQPGTQKQDWFNLMSVHQNHHAYTETGYLPENFLPEFLDFVVWGHEHECIIEPKYNPEMNFHVLQPGSSVATSLMPGEAVSKHVAVLSITGRDFKVDPIRLKTVRPFVMKEMVLSEDKEAKKLAKEDNRSKLTQYLVSIVEGLIVQAKREWSEMQDEADPDDEIEIPLPLIRLRIEYSAPDGGNFDCENPQRFSNRFVGKVANVNDVVQFYRKKAGATRKGAGGAELPEESILAQLSIDSVKVEKLVREFLTAQSLTILPQNSFGDAVSQFVDKDDKHAMEMFVNESLMDQIKHLMEIDQMDEDEIQNAMDQHKSKLEELFAAGHLKKTRRAKLKPRPENWDTDLDGDWEAQPGALIRSDVGEDEEEEEEEEEVAAKPTAKGRGKAAAPKKAAAPARKAAPAKAAPAKAAPAKNGRGKKKVIEDDEESEEEEVDGDVVMVSDDDESQLFTQPTKVTRKAAPPPKPTAPVRRGVAPAKRAVSPPKRAPPRAAAGKQTRLTQFSQPATQTQRGRGKAPARAISRDEISDEEDDAFEPAPSTTLRSTRSLR